MATARMTLHSNERCRIHRLTIGATLVEMIVVMAIIAIITAVAVADLARRRSQSGELDGTRKQMVALLREAQSRSVQQASSTSWGVHFDNSVTPPFYALFAGTYGTSSRVTYVRLPAGVAYVTSTVPASSTVNITFSQISGAVSASTSIGIYSTTVKAAPPAMITVSTLGTVSN
jgi:Tfp pilus assembly protein FimT